jgi:hypothetical protein
MKKQSLESNLQSELHMLHRKQTELESNLINKDQSTKNHSNTEHVSNLKKQVLLFLPKSCIYVRIQLYTLRTRNRNDFVY